MKSLSQLAIFVMGLGILSSDMSGQVTSPEAKVLSAKVSYCKHADDIAIAKVKLTVAIRNRTQWPVILVRKIDSVYDVKAISTDHKQIYEPHPSHYGTRDNIKLGSKPEEELFEIVPPDAAASRTVSALVPVARKQKVQGALNPGTYKFRATLLLWPFFNRENEAKTKALQWRRFGRLAASPVMLQSTSINFGLPVDLPPCGPAGPVN